MRRRDLILVAGAALFASKVGEAQRSSRLHKIGYLSPASPRSAVQAPAFEAFRQGMRDLGYIEGETLHIEARWAEGQYERLPDFAAELVRLEVECIVTHGAARGPVKQATATIPIVMATIADPIREGFAASLARPGGNITGLSIMLPEIVLKRLELLKEAVPTSSRIGFLFNPAAQGVLAPIDDVARQAEVLGLGLEPISVHSAAEFDSAFRTMSLHRVDALAVIEDAVFTINIQRLATAAREARLPSVGFKEWPEAGGLLAYDADIIPMYRRAAVFVDKILRGAKPGELPIEQPTKFQLIVNTRTANAVGLTVPPSILARADEVIE